MQPSAGRENDLQEVPGRPGAYTGKIKLAADAPEGMYVVHAWTGERTSPRAVGKATSSSADSLLITSSPRTSIAAHGCGLDDYVKDFRSLGGNFLIAHGLITPDKAFFSVEDLPDGRDNAAPRKTLVELVLRRADRKGWRGCSRSAGTDRSPTSRTAWARSGPSWARCMPSTATTLRMAGFYSYQEGSGNLLRPLRSRVRCAREEPGRKLAVGLRPARRRPLLAGYLSTVEELDIIIYQSGTYGQLPHGQPQACIRDGASGISARSGAARNACRTRLPLRTSRVRLHGKRPSQQFNAAAGGDSLVNPERGDRRRLGRISLSRTTRTIYAPLKKFAEIRPSRQATAAGLKAYDLITSEVAHAPNPLALYFPYSDWIIERWPDYFLPALDAFRVLGIPVDVLPYAPPLEESFYPYYPFHMNEDVLKRLLRERTVLVLPNVWLSADGQRSHQGLVSRRGGSSPSGADPDGTGYERRELFAARDYGERERGEYC